MIRHTLFALAALAMPIQDVDALSAATPASETNNTGAEEFIVNAWANAKTCDQQVAQPVTMASVIQDAEKLQDQCVIIEGYWRGRALFDTARHARSHRSMSSSKVARHRIGLYADWDKIDAPPAAPTRTGLVGILGLCETQWPDAIMVMGYCHYTSGPILLVSQRVAD